MLAYLQSNTILALALIDVVLADAGAPAYLALAALAAMLAYLRSATLLALALDALVVADAVDPAYFALAPSSVMLAHFQSAARTVPLSTIICAAETSHGIGNTQNHTEREDYG
jgi:hypothetical protein